MLRLRDGFWTAPVMPRDSGLVLARTGAPDMLRDGCGRYCEYAHRLLGVGKRRMTVSHCVADEARDEYDICNCYVEYAGYICCVSMLLF
jgi:hypothetical protein